jgi:hypothetical protein
MVDRINLVQEWPGKSGRGDRFPRARGTIAAQAMLSSGMLDGRKVVFLGKEVARCFGMSQLSYLSMHYLSMHAVWPICAEVFLLPHPSAVNAWWNDPKNVRAASRALKVFLSTNKSQVTLSHSAS